MQWIYNLIVVPLLYVGFFIISLFNVKVRKGIQGRKNLFAKLTIDLQPIHQPKIWFHVSSYGEFEQAKPVLTLMKKNHPDLFILVTFFSPSAYEHIKLTPPIDYISYLPFDSIFNARRFIAIVKPRLAVIVRHDIWPNFIWTLKKKRIPRVLIDASIPPHSSRFWPLIQSFNKNLYKNFDAILTISPAESNRIGRLVTDKRKLTVTGDTKYDQVYSRTLETAKIEHLLHHRYLSQKPIWVVGSSWLSDERIVIPAFDQLLKKVETLIMIIVPHDPSEKRVMEIEIQLANYKIKAVRYSQLTEETSNFNALIVDRMGLLANIYRLGRVAFVGGSIEHKVHNVLEPAAHGIPVLFGPKITTQTEASLLVEKRAAYIVDSIDEVVEKVALFIENKVLASQAGENARSVVHEHIGASEKTVMLLSNYLKLPN